MKRQKQEYRKQMLKRQAEVTFFLSQPKSKPTSPRSLSTMSPPETSRKEGFLNNETSSSAMLVLRSQERDNSFRQILPLDFDIDQGVLNK
jgi:hypothetical protein